MFTALYARNRMPELYDSSVPICINALLLLSDTGVAPNASNAHSAKRITVDPLVVVTAPVVIALP